MDKYLVKPTQIIGENGYVYKTSSLDQTPAITDLKKKVDNIVLDTTAISEVRARVSDLESINGAMNDRIDVAESTANEAKNTANIAHNIASQFQTDLDIIGKTATNAEEKAVAAAENASSLNRDYENLKSRVEVLENLDGSPSINVGPQTMGSEGKLYTAKWAKGTEVRTMTYGANDTLDQVIDWIHDPLANGLTDHETRIAALESGSGGTSGSCLEQEMTIKPGALLDNSQASNLGIDKNEEFTDTAKKFIEQSVQLSTYVQALVMTNIVPPLGDHEDRITALESGSGGSSGTTNCSCNVTDHITTVMGSANDMYGYLDYTQPTASTGNNLTAILDQLQSNIEVNKNVIQNHMSKIKSNETTLTSHTNSIQSLDTRTGSHTASIGQLENRMTDVETQTNNNKTDISDIKTQIQNLGSGGSSTITHIGDHNLKSDGSTFTFLDDESHERYNFKTLNEVLEWLLPFLESFYNRYTGLEYEFNMSQE